MLSLITLAISNPYHRDSIEYSPAIEQCQNGRVCMNSCYSDGQLTKCTKLNVLKSVLFDPPFSPILPSIYLRFVRIDSDDDMFNGNADIKKENVTSDGMNIRFDLFAESTAQVICADWHACSLDSN